MNYRSDIDGLRAISVVLVILYHADLGFRSGFVGVDVFFVISGYLVSQVIHRGLERKTFSLKTFFARRIRRLLPALIAVCLFTAGVGYFTMLPRHFEQLGYVLLCQPLFATNFYYWRTLEFGYFGSRAQNYPLLHLWSLAVEEQFYLLYPTTLQSLFGRFSKLHFKRALISLFLLSFALSALGSSRCAVPAYFLLPTRAFEILAGVIAAHASLTIHSAAREVFSVLSLACILVSGCAIDPHTPLPGYVALWPTVAAAFLLWAGSQGETLASRILSTPALVRLGLWSYSLYLWHWPIIALLKYALLWNARVAVMTCMAVVPIGFLSWSRIEQPCRLSAWMAPNYRTFSFAALASLILFVLGLGITLGKGLPGRMPARALKMAEAEFDKGAFIKEHTKDDIERGDLTRFGVHKDRPDVMLIGDSHAMAVLPGLDLACRLRGISGVAITHSGTPPVVCGIIESAGLHGDDLKDFVNSALAKIEYYQPRKVLLVASWGGYQGVAGFEKGLAETLRVAASRGRTCYLMPQIPYHPVHVPRALAQKIWHGTHLWDDNTSIASCYELNDKLKTMALNAAVDRVEILDPLPFFDARGLCRLDLNGVCLYRDESHLSVDGSRFFADYLLARMGAWSATDSAAGR